MSERGVLMISGLPDGTLKRYMFFKLCYDTFHMITTMPDEDIEQVPIYCDNVRRYFYGNMEWPPINLNPMPAQREIQTEALRLMTFLRVSMHHMVTGVELDMADPERRHRNLNFALGLRFHFNDETTHLVIEQGVREQREQQDREQQDRAQQDRAQQDHDEPSTVTGGGSERDLSENDFGSEHGDEVEIALTQLRDMENEAREISQAVSDISWKTAIEEFEFQQDEP